MSKTDNPALSGDHVSGVRDMKQAMSSFVSELKSFRDDIQSKLKQTEERLTMLDRKTTFAGRPHLAASPDAGAPHQ